ncbi:MAG: M15 family metallopeptidase [Candidatus Riflebacteria bacterium]|nr:M15 family metallopeptidase [Candidatus Riflebacteria bacterium]
MLKTIRSAGFVLLLVVFMTLTVSGFTKDDTQTDTLTAKGFLCLQDLVPEIIPDVRYATTNNFTHKQIYDSDRLYLLAPAARQFKMAARYLKITSNLYFRVFDAYRPLSVQKKFWAILPDPNFVADPKTGSRHNRGAAIDLTLADSEGNALEMGTEFDDFTSLAAWSAEAISDEARQNRNKLKEVMEKFGFKALPSEWWHFDFVELQNTVNLDIPIPPKKQDADSADNQLTCPEQN